MQKYSQSTYYVQTVEHAFCPQTNLSTSSIAPIHRTGKQSPRKVKFLWKGWSENLNPGYGAAVALSSDKNKKARGTHPTPICVCLGLFVLF